MALKWIAGKGYDWRTETDAKTRTADTLVIRVPIPDGVGKQNIDVVFGANRLRIAYTERENGRTRTVIDGETYGPIKIQDSLWFIETEKDGRHLIVELCKGGDSNAWTSVIKPTLWESTQKALYLDNVTEYDWKGLIRRSGPGALLQLGLGLAIMVVIWLLIGAPLAPGPSVHLGRPKLA